MSYFYKVNDKRIVILGCWCDTLKKLGKISNGWTKNINRNLSRWIGKESVWFCKHLH